MVEFHLGKREQISIGPESTYGTAVTPTFIVGKNSRIEPNEANNWQETLGADSSDIHVQDFEAGPKDVPFNLVYTPQEWRMLKFVLGSVADAGGPTYTHTFTNAATVPSFTLERSNRKTSPKSRRYTGCKINRYTLNWARAAGGGIGSYVTATAEVVAQNVDSDSTVTSLTALATDGYQFRHVKLTLNSVEQTYLIGGTMFIFNKLNDGRVANSTLDRLISEPNPTVRRFGGTFRIMVSDETLFELFDAGVAVGGTNKLEFIKNATNDKLVATLNTLIIEKAPDPSDLEEVNIVELAWSAKTVDVVATDAVATYV